MRQKTEKERLISVAAFLMRGIPHISEYAEDMPKTTPKAVLREIAKAQEWARKLGIEIREIADRLGGTDEDCLRCDKDFCALHEPEERGGTDEPG